MVDHIKHCIIIIHIYGACSSINIDGKPKTLMLTDYKALVLCVYNKLKTNYTVGVHRLPLIK